MTFDFSLKLCRGDVARHIFYGECKYRNEQRGSVRREFKDFLKRAFRARSGAEDDDASDSAVFVFLGNIPTDDWRIDLKDRQRSCETAAVWGQGSPPGRVVERFIRSVHLLTLSTRIVSRR